METVLRRARLYGIVDLGYVTPADVVEVSRNLCAGGVDLLQLRAKGMEKADVERLGQQILPVTRDAGVPFIVNDHPEVAASLGSEGVHVGQDDGWLESVKAVVGDQCIVGRSTHSAEQAAQGAEEGADYLGFGPLFPTGTKPGRPAIGLEAIQSVHRSLDLPIFCIGGVNPARLETVLAAGARRVVVVSALLQAPDVTRAVKELKARLPELD